MAARGESIWGWAGVGADSGRIGGIRRVSVVWVNSDEERRNWDALVQSHSAGTPYLLSWYLDQQHFPRTRTDIALVEQNKQVAAGAVMYTFRLPLLGRPS